MKFSKITIAAALLAAGAALAQVPTLFIASPNGTEIIRAQNSGPQIANVYLSQLRDARGYQKVVPLTAFSIQIANGTSQLQLTPAGTLATGTILFPLVPQDGQVLFLFTTQTQTAVTLTAAAGQTLNGGITAMTANTAYGYIYSASNTSWDRIQ